MSYVKGDTSHVQGTSQVPWCVFMLPNISLCVGLLNRLTYTKEDTRGACSKCGYSESFRLF